MDDRHDLAGVLGLGVVVRVEHEEAARLAADVAAGPVPLTALDHHHQPAGLAGVFRFNRDDKE